MSNQIKQVFLELAKMQEYIHHFEKEFYHAIEKGHQQENGLDQHLGISQGRDVQSHGEEIRQGESQQAGYSCSNGGETAEPGEQRKIKGLNADYLYYISGPMTGKKDYNYPLFNEVTHRMRDSGYRVVNPVETCAHLGVNRPANLYLRRDIQALCNCDAILMLPEWEFSHGAFLEFTVARGLSMPAYYWRDSE